MHIIMYVYICMYTCMYTYAAYVPRLNNQEKTELNCTLFETIVMFFDVFRSSTKCTWFFVWVFPILFLFLLFGIKLILSKHLLEKKLTILLNKFLLFPLLSRLLWEFQLYKPCFYFKKKTNSTFPPWSMSSLSSSQRLVNWGHHTFPDRVYNDHLVSSGLDIQRPSSLMTLYCITVNITRPFGAQICKFLLLPKCFFSSNWIWNLWDKIIFHYLGDQWYIIIWFFS